MTTTQKRWSTAIVDFLHPRVLTMLFLGLSAGIPILLIFSSLSLWLREAGLERSTVTYFSWAALGYSFKFIWAPLIDRLPVPILTAMLGRRRAWLLVSQLFIILAILWMAYTDPVGGGNALTLMAVAAVLLGFSSATQDIVIDAYRIEAANSDSQAMMSATYIAGYRIGMLVAGAGALFLASHWGSESERYVYEAWQKTYIAMAATMLLGILTTLTIPEPGRFRQMKPQVPAGYLATLIALLFVGSEVAYAMSGNPDGIVLTIMWIVRITLLACAMLLLFTGNADNITSAIVHHSRTDLPGLILLPMMVATLLFVTISHWLWQGINLTPVWLTVLVAVLIMLVYYIRLLLKDTNQVIQDSSTPSSEQFDENPNAHLTTRDHLETLVLFAAVVAGIILSYRYIGTPLIDLATGSIASSPLGKLGLGTTRLTLSFGSGFFIAYLLIKLNIINRETLLETYIRPLKDFFSRYGLNIALMLLLLIGLYRISDIVLGVISNVFYQDLGFTKPEIASIVKTFGLFMTIAGGFLGGILSTKFGVMRILFLGAALSAATNLLFMVLAGKGHDITMLYVVISADNLSAGLASAAFIAFLSSLTNIKFTAVQYAIFSSLMTLLPKTLGGYSGTMVDNMGYGNFFLITAIIGIPVLLLIVYAGKVLDLKEPELKR